jgi:hypothetical protein
MSELFRIVQLLVAGSALEEKLSRAKPAASDRGSSAAIRALSQGTPRSYRGARPAGPPRVGTAADQALRARRPPRAAECMCPRRAAARPCPG